MSSPAKGNNEQGSSNGAQKPARKRGADRSSPSKPEPSEAVTKGTRRAQSAQKVAQSDPFDLLFRSIEKETFDQELFKKGVKLLLEELSAKYQTLTDEYNIVMLFDDTILMREDADAIYDAISGFSEEKPILLVLLSNGGSIEAGYLISKLCHDSATDKFSVVVPRQAKSAATLICCGADEVHMGALSELGPIDPQINGMPALGLKNSVHHIAELTSGFPGASGMFAEYLNRAMQVIDLGYYERVAESAVQYAERLLKKRRCVAGRDPQAIATDLVYAYKDHGFVIDHQEGENVFGAGFLKFNTEEYQFGNQIYGRLSFARRIAQVKNYTFLLTGTLKSEPLLIQSKRSPRQSE